MRKCQLEQSAWASVVIVKVLVILCLARADSGSAKSDMQRHLLIECGLIRDRFSETALDCKRLDARLRAA